MQSKDETQRGPLCVFVKFKYFDKFDFIRVINMYITITSYVALVVYVNIGGTIQLCQ